MSDFGYLNLPEELKLDIAYQVYKWSNWEEREFLDTLLQLPASFREHYEVEGTFYRGINQNINNLRDMEIASWSYDKNFAFYVGYRTTPNNHPTHIYKKVGKAFSLLKLMNEIIRYISEGDNYPELARIYDIHQDLYDFRECLRVEEEELLAPFSKDSDELIETVEGFPDYIKELEDEGYFDALGNIN